MDGDQGGSILISFLNERVNNYKKMPSINTTIWDLQPHTEAKHIILRKYLNAWLPIITRFNPRVLYIDGFAGPGLYSKGEVGSPIIAIKAVIEHKMQLRSKIKMLFIELNKDRFNHLQEILEEQRIPSNIEIKCHNEKFEKVIKDILDKRDERHSSLIPTFAFIDPFGFTGIPFTLVKRLMESPKCEVLITFMYDQMNRFVSDRKLWNSLDNTFGNNKWRGVLNLKNPSQRVLFLHNIYKNQLECEANIKYVRSFKMKNKINKVEYFLFFGTNNELGLEKMKDAMWKVDEIGSFQFSDATYNPSQTVLFKKEPSFTLLKKQILQEFCGKIVSIDDIERFVLLKTSYKKTHLRKNVLKELEKMKPQKIKKMCKGCSHKNSCKRKKYAFPNHCIIKFS